MRARAIALVVSFVIAAAPCLAQPPQAPPNPAPASQTPVVNCGSRERPENVKANHELLKAAGINTAMYISPGTAHEWQTWRRNLREFAVLLFKDPRN